MAGMTVAVGVFVLQMRYRRNADARMWWIVLGSLVGSAVGAKSATAWRYFTTTPESSINGVLLQGGKSVLGGLAGAYAGVLITKRIVGYRRSTGDLFAPAVAAGLAVGRWGCFLTEQLGTPTDLPWGIHGSGGGPAMHPSFLYEIAFHAVMFGLLLHLRPRIRVEGRLFKIYLLSYALFRFSVEFVRGNPELWAGMSGSQLFLVPSTALLLAYFLKQRRTGQWT